MSYEYATGAQQPIGSTPTTTTTGTAPTMTSPLTNLQQYANSYLSDANSSNNIAIPVIQPYDPNAPQPVMGMSGGMQSADINQFGQPSQVYNPYMPPASPYLADGTNVIGAPAPFNPYMAPMIGDNSLPPPMPIDMIDRSSYYLNYPTITGGGMAPMIGDNSLPPVLPRPPMPPTPLVQQPTGPTPSTLNQLRLQMNNLQQQRRTAGFNKENYGQQMSDMRHQYNTQRKLERHPSNPARPVAPLPPVR